MHYRGRFAPSPTGDLHFGSLIAAAASYLDARAHGGQWLLRIEDVDKTRCVPDAADQIQRTLQAFGLEWDGEVMVQSLRDERYLEVLEQLAGKGLLYPCQCSRKQIAAAASHTASDGSLVYPATCRLPVQSRQLADFPVGSAWRLRVDDAQVVAFVDAIQGQQQELLGRDVGDFVLRRADGLFAYQLAVVVDDADQGITHIVRGADLLGSTTRQIYLQQCLGYPQPRYAHLPLALDGEGKKWSKQRLAPALKPAEASHLLWLALRFLGQPVPAGLDGAPVAELLAWGVANWSLAAVPAVVQMDSPAELLPG
ncbi:MAG: tRNA glutamyl-Q(34) synthetase GluQRS [Gammaproteobacteria bacterium]|nr:tRNA glutamyl-Q(34) synthetase GluQRS [Gammaproteobacteria bacterium]